jgi:hypothetical protein
MLEWSDERQRLEGSLPNDFGGGTGDDNDDGCSNYDDHDDRALSSVEFIGDSSDGSGK